jgi:nucleoside-diphosphate-sugar epimerase
MKSMRVLVTGCSGAIGKYLTRELINQNDIDFVYGVDRENSLERLIDSNFLDDKTNKFIPLKIDLSSEISMKCLPDVDYVYHLAAVNGTQLFYDLPWEVFVNSIKPTINLLDFYKERNLTRFIYTSSSEVYASLTDLGVNIIPTPENCAVGFTDVFNPRWSYGCAKLSGEVALISAAKQFNLNFSIIRYHNVFGKDMGLNHVIPDFIARAQDGVFKLYGAENVRSFIYIKDAIEATLIVAKNSKSLNKVVNIGTDEMLNMRDLSHEIMQVFGWEGSVVEYSAPVGSTFKRCPDVSFLRDELGFKPKYTLKSGLRELLR